MSDIKILIIDDEVELTELIKLKLKELDYLVVAACTGYEGLYRYIQERPDLIILDVRLPDLEGFEVCREIRRNICDKTTPIIMVSGLGDDYSKILGRVIGANRYLTKPFGSEELLSEIGACLSLN